MLPEASRVGAGRFCTFFKLLFWGKGCVPPKSFGGFNSDRLYGDCLSSSSSY